MKTSAFFGQIVLWKPTPHADLSDCTPAIALSNGPILNLSLFPRNGTGVMYAKDSVRHEDDPEYEKYAHTGSGAWSHLKQDKDIIRVMLDGVFKFPEETTVRMTTSPSPDEVRAIYGSSDEPPHDE